MNAASDEVRAGILFQSPNVRAAFFHRTNRILRDAMQPLRSRYDEENNRKGQPSSFEACHVTFVHDNVLSSSRGQVYRLMSVRLHVTPEHVVFETTPLQACFRTHAADQLYNRGHQVGSAFRSLATDCLDWYLLQKIADDMLDGIGLTRLSIPGHGRDGLILGYFDRSAALPAGDRFTMKATGRSREIVPQSPFQQGLYIANTYLGSFDVKPIQLALRGCFLQWKGACGPSYDKALQDEIWSGRQISPALQGLDSALPHDSADLLETFLLDDRALHAMQSFPPPKKFSTDTTGKRTYEDVMEERYDPGYQRHAFR